MTDEFEYAPAWLPQKNEDHPKAISGKVVEIAVGNSEYKGEYPILTIEQQDGSEWAVHANSTVLLSELTEARPRVGDDLKIKYLGKSEPSNGKQGYHKFKVRGGQPKAWSWGGDDSRDAGDGDVPIASAGLPTPPPLPPEAADDPEGLPF